MAKETAQRLSRREFARRAAMISAAAPLAGTGLLAEGALPIGMQQQQAENLPKLSPEGQAEADARYQQVLGQYGSRLSGDEKNLVRTLCIFLQPALEHVRAYPLTNGDAPALYLKPLVEREKKPAAIPSPKNAKPAAKKS